MKKIILLLSPLLLYAELTLKELEKSPKGHVRNFKIWQFMDKDISPAEADAAYCLVDGYDKKIFNRYAKKTLNKVVKEKYRCSHLKTQALLHETNATCLDQGFSLKSALKLNNQQRTKICKTLDNSNAQKSKLIALMNGKNLARETLKFGSKAYLEFFNTIGSANRQKLFNLKLPQKDINALAKDKRFARAIKYIVTDPKMNNMQESLLLLKPQELSARSYFFLGLNALRFKATKKAMHYFEISQKKAYYQMDKDKALFWKYLASNKKEYLKKLTLSSDINIYTLYAKEKFKLEVNNYFSKQALADRSSLINLQDPYTWEEILEEIRHADKQGLKRLLKEYSSKDDDVLHAFIYTKALKYKTHNYIMPYKNATDELSGDDKALLYALARQESHFIPSAISRSYALGVMQMMPFLIKSLAKQKKESPSLDDMFNPYKNITYAKKHIRYLQKHLYHPLFIAYAYNGGIGFTKRHLLGGTFRKGSYEPFLSMELMANTESREYGKKVLANYVIYKKILKEEVKITSLFQMLTEPSRTDRFRI